MTTAEMHARDGAGEPALGEDAYLGDVLARFEACAVASPSATAMVDGDVVLSYAALNARANRIARWLMGQGIGPGHRVALLAERSTHAVASMLGAMKAGAAYVPLDLAQPLGRIESILQDCRPAALLVDGEGIRRIVDSEFFLVASLLEVDAADLSGLDEGNVELPRSDDDPVYCMYTSGSTGRPKGVVVQRDALANYVDWAAARYLTGATRSFALISPLSFDLTVTSIYLPLSRGLAIRVYRDQATGGLPVVSAIKEGQVDIVKLTPAHLAILAEADLGAPTLEAMIVGGEDLKSDIARRIVRKFAQPPRIHNEYGPTETVVGCIEHLYDPGTDVSGSVPIGKPIAGTRIHLLDDRLEPVAPGQIGQVHIAGDCVSQGYLDAPGATAARFLPDPHAKGQRMYASGDLARTDGAGNLVYMGRSDHQVKVNGHRVELGEVENHLIAHPEVRECIVETLDKRDPFTDAGSLFHCMRCGLASNYPNTTYDTEGVCNHCHAYDRYRSVIEPYFLALEDLREVISGKQGRFLFLLSGGKDSTYALCKMVELGAEVIAVTFDPGYLSESAKENIDRAVSRLGIEHRYLTTSAMGEIFADSLRRFSNVCNGCFKALYTLSVNLALELGIDRIVTGLSRGQLFETRLANVYRSEAYDEARIEREILAARRIYHRMDDAVSRLLDTRCFARDDVLERVQFVDFYRYCDVPVSEMYRYLEREVGWKRPTDTGRSTNCLINNTGIYVHNLERGYHNYALPYSWDVRLGHKTREEAIRELDDLAEIDPNEARRILGEVGYDLQTSLAGSEVGLVAYYVSEVDIPPASLRRHLSVGLPEHMVPRYFVRLDALPLTSNGKINRRALPRPEARKREEAVDYVAPASDIQEHLALLWSGALQIDRIGVHDDFFRLGGNSMPAALMLFKVAEIYGKVISLAQFAQAPTIARLAEQLAIDVELEDP